MSFGDIFDYTRVLIFYGCPHRAFNIIDMEDRLSRFLFRHTHENGPKITGSTATIQGLANAVVDINGLFSDVKHTFRSYVVSYTAPPTGESDIDPVGSPDLLSPPPHV